MPELPPLFEEEPCPEDEFWRLWDSLNTYLKGKEKFNLPIETHT